MATQTLHTDIAADTDLSDKAQALAEYLYSETLEDGGELFFKAKFIEDDVGLTSKEIGGLMLRLQDELVALNIEQWSYTSATTWRVTTADDHTTATATTAASHTGN